MASHNIIGNVGEELAANWLRQKGYEIWHRNWRSSQYEIDIIARKNNKLHFIEIKTRQSSKYGHPEQSVTKQKFKSLQYAANSFLSLNPGYPWIQYDILSIIMEKGKEPTFFLIEDVFL